MPGTSYLCFCVDIRCPSNAVLLRDSQRYLVLFTHCKELEYIIQSLLNMYVAFKFNATHFVLVGLQSLYMLIVNKLINHPRIIVFGECISSRGEYELTN